MKQQGFTPLEIFKNIFHRGNKNKQSLMGFTLIEAVVASAVFVFFMSSVMGVYLSTLRLDSRTRAQRAVTDNGRFIMDFLAKEIRNGHIDFAASACSGTVTSTTDLCLVNQSGDAEHIFALSPVALLTGTGTDLLIAKNAGTTSLNSGSVKVTQLQFLVSPNIDPLTSAKLANEQPHVTVILQLKYFSTRDQVTLNLETTLSENYYPSR